MQARRFCAGVTQVHGWLSLRRCEAVGGHYRRLAQASMVRFR
jgi:hypothetical protein